MSNGFSSAVKLIVVPVLNPDGYNYARKSDRLWKKNRSPTDNLICPGVNLDRNSPFNHKSLSDACSEDFGGASPLSENELRGLSEYLSRAGPVLSFLSVSEKAFGEDRTNVFYSSASVDLRLFMFPGRHIVPRLSICLQVSLQSQFL